MYRAAVRSVLVTPIGVGVPGNGLSQRCRMWADALSTLGPVTRVEVPIVGPVDETDEVIVFSATAARSPLVPRLAQGVTRELGFSAGNQVHRLVGPIDVVVGVRSYIGEMCLGMQTATGARLVVDLDDDDVAFFTAAGQPDEAERFRNLIAQIASRADVLVSADGFGDTEVVPNGVEVPEAAHRAVLNGRAPRVLFLGNMGYRPNRDAAEWIINEIAPVILERFPEATITIAGPGSETLPRFGRGFVDDLDSLMAETDVCIAPLREGSGTHIKTLDAWARGVPVVSTHVGVRGLDAIDGTHVLLADDASSIADAVGRLVQTPSLARDLGSSGRQLVIDKYSRDAAIEAARGVVLQCAGGDSTDTNQSTVVARIIDTVHLTETAGGLIVLDTATGSVHSLDPTASVIFSLIDGRSSDDEIAAELRAIYAIDETPIDAVVSVVSDLVQIGLAFRVRLHREGLRP